SAMREMKAKMSPAQRKQMEDIMAMQNIKIVGDRIVSMVCITPEIAKNAAQEMLKSATDAADQDGDCTIKPSPRAGNKVATSFTCTSQPPMSGKFEITFQSDTAYSTQLQAVQDGREMNSQGSGRWVSKDCGNVKPPEPSGR
ncbi:MAG: DUF3617 domain-containing protein, partial [Betaproteobacteria bacterium]|nr:DUF3617 domain-containing protein [Betaproteobacteria bacterium]